jgi:hypothetical protein
MPVRRYDYGSLDILLPVLAAFNQFKHPFASKYPGLIQLRFHFLLDLHRLQFSP